MHKLAYRQITFGADPELFIAKDGQVIGSEKILPKGGLETHTNEVWDDNKRAYVPVMEKVVVIDGVQAEFNVIPSTCRQTFSSNLKMCFAKLNEALVGHGAKADFSQSVKVTEEEMSSLSKESQQFGCSPSENAYEKSEIAIKDASKYMVRSAGGHIHIGNAGRSEVANALKNHVGIVRMLDILVGNTCVLIDRDYGNVERRKVYGKAGEYRTPSHGLEYRTLSNFWLRSYPTMSFVLGMVRYAVSVAMDESLEQQILERVSMADIQKAINTNDYDLAYQNFNKIKDLIKGTIYDSTPGNTVYPLEGDRMDRFEYFVEKGLDHWFKHDVMDYWLTHTANNEGWERFVDEIVAAEMAATVPQETIAA